jgi:hypothetical protein
MILHFVAGGADWIGTGPLCGASMAADMVEDRERVTCETCRKRLGMTAPFRVDVPLSEFDPGGILLAAGAIRAKPVTWARRCALDAVMAWIRFICPDCGGTSWTGYGTGESAKCSSCDFKWSRADDWRYFFLVTPFASREAFELGVSLPEKGRP